MDFVTALRTCFGKYVTFGGRARRSEYWYFILFVVLGNLATGFLDDGLGTSGALNAVFSLGVLLPQIAVSVRRLHDTGHSGWWLLGCLGPATILGIGVVIESMGFRLLAGVLMAALGITLLIWLCRAGDAGPNRFGASPIATLTAPWPG
ncbi:MAG: DUF805 domain-containing protein [Paracraurococcus sp.]|jgi:uncharacterized membrane protein YhaH (DUF805 family)